MAKHGAKVAKKAGKSGRSGAGAEAPSGEGRKAARKGMKKATRHAVAPQVIAPMQLVAPAEIDVALFEEAYGRILPRAQAQPKAAIVTFNVDLQLAALVALKAAQTASEPKLRKRFANLAKSGEYSDAPVAALADVAMASRRTPR
jgi:hypothetical protein